MTGQQQGSSGQPASWSDEGVELAKQRYPDGMTDYEIKMEHEDYTRDDLFDNEEPIKAEEVRNTPIPTGDHSMAF
jgi:hypothetical protein